ncbi:23S rRNA (uracil(1939)-C(5))-methyltransferase RlmD [Vagococcus xieshaowenii]|uniref:23S rRNA (Uracil(1939)-C(5))-methyltransferase RlmD n=1 Tax=Vagococcus xieshaowenii TaxID=2562451 RepID=A0AAJ5EFF8_9ENTE|nr:23S rRNA (uracil(1939)-C(5))-methyltransferase RlmD [Vagococcus xieshaowenii]TFZ40878.1 23S rRNA (uracil(1939)-C(5))-methyltransferase RlmD [Vagococcus xieshaowenii]
MKIQHNLKVGQKITLPIKRLGINGEGIGYFKKTIVFIPGALPDETVTATISTVAPKFAEAELNKVNKASAQRVQPRCAVYEECGGCQLQHLAYEAQLVFKNDVVKQSLAKHKPIGYQHYKMRPAIGMSNPWQYRNKLQFQIRKDENGVIAGLYQPNSHRLVGIDDCVVQQPITMDILNGAVRVLEKYNVPIYDERRNSGIVKTLMIRTGLKTGETQLVFITHSPKLPQKNQMINELRHEFPQLVSIMQNVQPTKSSVIMGDETLHLWGKESIAEQLEDVHFNLSPRAFFQLNPEQTAVLYDEARKALDAQSGDKIIDAYCGVGTIGLSIAKLVGEVRGMDTIPSAIEDAKENAKRLGVTNTYYEAGTAEELIPKWLEKGFRPDGIIVDPPRTGLDKKLIDTLLKYPSKKLVYVSCNPSTLARDLVYLTKKYNVDYLQSVDMFPQTARAEVVAKLVLK